MFAATGQAPRIARVEAFAFHDPAGRIRHMHHRIVLEGAEPRPEQAMLDEIRAHALERGVDLRKLEVLHVTTPFNPGAQHRVDVKKGVLVELRPPARVLGSPALTRRKTARPGTPKRKG
jgi:hypothetical protein